MAIFDKLFRKAPDPAEQMRPLWNAVIIEARKPLWYAELGVEDSVNGRFDMITAILSLVLLRMERPPALREQSAWLTELFVSDMDGQMREGGVGDLVVGKKVGKLVGVLGGRLGVYREAITTRDQAALADSAKRNVTFADSGHAEIFAMELMKRYDMLCAADTTSLTEGKVWP